MKRIIHTLLLTLVAAAVLAQQDRQVQNRPYTDLRAFHFGILVGTHLQDVELHNVGTVSMTDENGYTTEQTITCDQDRWDPGFTVGVLGEARINEHLAFRIAPQLYFGARHFTFHNISTGEEKRQDLKSIYIAADMNLIFAAKRSNNHRPYLMVGVNPMINLSGKDEDYLRLKRYDCMLEVGLGCDSYLPFFKLRPELKFCYSIANALDMNHVSKIKDPAMRSYASCVDKAQSKLIALTFYFE